MKRTAIGLAVALTATGALAQDPAGRPLSAIDWLSRSVATPQSYTPPRRATPRTAQPDEEPVTDSATIPEVTVMPLGTASPDPIGLLSPQITGLPRTLWAGSEEDVLTALIAAERVEALPVMRELMHMLLLAAADPPAGADRDGDLFLARVDKLLDLGALDPAWEMLDTADPGDPALFRRYFDVALLTGRESRACRVMDEMPTLAPTLNARIFCLAHQGDWRAAALTLNTARALGDVSEEDEDLLTRFLDPQAFEGLPPLRIPERPTPLDFRLREGIGEALPTNGMPRAFAHADLREVTGWKAQLEAAERLARVGAVDDTVLLDLYTLQEPAASGSVWERADAVQAFEAALQSGDADRVAETLPEVWAAMEEARVEVPFARLFGERLAAVPLEGRAARIAFRVALLSTDYEALLRDLDPQGTEERFLAAIARGEAATEVPRDQTAEAIQAAFDTAEPPARLMTLASEDRLGEAILRAITLFDAGTAGDPGAVTDALTFFRAVGLEDHARRAALQLMILSRNP